MTTMLAACGGGSGGGGSGNNNNGGSSESTPLDLSNSQTSEAVAAYASLLGNFAGDVSSFAGSNPASSSIAHPGFRVVRAVRPRTTDACSGGGSFDASSSGNTETISFDECVEDGNTVNGQVSVTEASSDSGTADFGSGTTPFTLDESSDGLVVGLLGGVAFTEDSPSFSVQFQGTSASVSNSGNTESVSLVFGESAGDPLAIEETEENDSTEQLSINGPFEVKTTGFSSSACPAGSATFTTTSPIVIPSDANFPSSGTLTVTSGSLTETITLSSSGASVSVNGGTPTTYTAAELQSLCAPAASS
jgi:hypothetical protein